MNNKHQWCRSIVNSLENFHACNFSPRYVGAMFLTSNLEMLTQRGVEYICRYELHSIL